METYDFTVMGACPAGCALAARLSECDVSVLCLEAGIGEVPPLLQPEIDNPAHWGFLQSTAIDWQYRSVPPPGRRWFRGARVCSYECRLYHQAGSRQIGARALTAVDPRLRVHGVQNLHVADASVMPTVTSGNTVAACFMIGEKAAAMILNGN